MRAVAFGVAAVIAFWRAASASAADPARDGDYPPADRAREENKDAAYRTDRLTRSHHWARLIKVDARELEALVVTIDDRPWRAILTIR